MQLQLYRSLFAFPQIQLMRFLNHLGITTFYWLISFLRILVLCTILLSLIFAYDCCRREIAEHLLECLEDEEATIREHASNLLPMIG